MASPQKENGYTAIANELLERLIQIPLLGAELAICLYIIRKTYGYQKTQDKISLSQFMSGTARSKNTILKALRALQVVHLVELVKKGDRVNSNTWRFIKDFDAWVVQGSGSTKGRRKVVHRSGTKVVQGGEHTKERLNKYITKEKQNQNLKRLKELKTYVKIKTI